MEYLESVAAYFKNSFSVSILSKIAPPQVANKVPELARQNLGNVSTIVVSLMPSIYNYNLDLNIF